ncbi:hypothetical protein M422DRAFT_203039 [Sphaerobolus stellatus SS14]|nr:hypothetical protein M422DRAFT_203039 [Sphaerobolus stellatus SS14]
MAEPTKGVCKFHSMPQGCRRGNRCKNSHDSSALPARGGRAGSSRPLFPHQAQIESGGIPNTPRQVCRMYWQYANCDRGFECTFKHTRNPISSAPASSTVPDGAEDDTPDFFSVEGMAAMTGIMFNNSHRMTPSEAHNHVKPFLHDNYHFENAAKIQGFVRIIASVNDRNKSWNSDNAQAFLDLLAKGNGILRIGDVLHFELVSNQVSFNTQVLPFQSGYSPVLEYFASHLVLRSTWQKNINHLYTVIEENYEAIHKVLRSCVGRMIEARSWKDAANTMSRSTNLDGVVVFKTLSTVLLQYVNRFKTAVRNHPEIIELVGDLVNWFDIWAADVSSRAPQFDDSITAAEPSSRTPLLNHLREDIKRLATIVQRESNNNANLTRSTPISTMTATQRREAEVMQLLQTYDPPGDLRPGGPRHDNDFADIALIRVAPTHNELLCSSSSYLPIFRAEAPYHLPVNTMDRHLDIQFRLLREELISPIRSSISAICNDLNIVRRHRSSTKHHPTKLEGIMEKGGGPYKTTGFDSLFFFVYTNVQFAPAKAERRDLTVGMVVDAPPGTARDLDASKRHAFWKHSHRLRGGSLVALVIVSPRQFQVFLGTIASFNDDIADSSRASSKEVQVRISFFDPEVELRALKCEKLSKGTDCYAFLVDNSVMYEAARPFLERLQTVEPTELPFSRYIAHNGPLANIQVFPPRYATAPRFKYKLSCLGAQSWSIDDLDLQNPDGVPRARQQLLQHSRLDPSQVGAIVDTLTREVSLIQGPPGTGKSFIGREILRVLIQSNVKPIVLIAYTNHALDHMLTAILDENITKRLVRLGSRSSDEHIAEYTLDKLEKIAEKGSLDRSIGRQYAAMKRIEEEMSKVMESIQLPTISAEDVINFMLIHYPEHASSLTTPPYWIQSLSEKLWADEEENGEWVAITGKHKKVPVESMNRTFYGFWKEATDINFLTSPVPVERQGRRKKKQSAMSTAQEHPMVAQFFTDLGFGNERPPVPKSDRNLASLLACDMVWSMSKVERQRMAETWEGEMRKMGYESHFSQYEELRKSYKEACQEYNDIRDETRRRLLNKVDLIGCTTTGAAKLISLLTSIGPRVLMVEEAGQVLEAHIITSLVPSVQHLICIGDPQQLPPTLATFALSMDSERGKELFKFDRSLMERLADGGMSMTQINIQRRMCPSISHFIRTILYPRLEDNRIVMEYPHVHGMSKDVYFLNHTNAEGGAEDSVSKFNNYEVAMIRDLVLYFLKQGTYSAPGDIAVLCAYLGQLQKVRQALKDLKISVSVNERDEEQLARQGIEGDVAEPSFEQVQVAKHIRLGTVDIYQGQEAKVVIVSLVRNTGNFETQSASIGFLKSSNRINVALSRAKHGLYILGNASNLRKNPTWLKIIQELEEHQQIGIGFPIRCARHPEQVQMISQPGELNRYAPEGGCLLPCGTQLPCGHICPSLCHAILDDHRSTRCRERCSKAACPRRHPCPRECSDDCGDCVFPIYNVNLPCGHTAKSIPCHMLERLDDVKCRKLVEKRLLSCEHSATIECHKKPSSVFCKELCSGTLPCCSKSCKSRCGNCQKETGGAKVFNTTSKIRRTAHSPHSCECSLYCQHECGLNCHSKEEKCNSSCQKPCRQVCSHQKGSKPCSVPCAPCMEPYMWRCMHRACPVTCGSICTRLPCDEPCPNMLRCGHRCPSVCGEICTAQVCLQCLPLEKKQDIADFILQRQLDELDITSAELSERVITLTCKHIFTVETLDGHCDLSSYYEIDVMGRFISTKSPPIAYQSPPVCPTCRGPISALRYGRVTKRATLDILEQNVANTMSRSLQILTPAFEKVSFLLDRKKEQAAKIIRDTNNTHPPSRDRARGILENVTMPLPVDILGCGSMHTVHGLSANEAKTWQDIVKDLLDVYHQTEEVANTRGVHVKAYEGALVTLYRLELDAIFKDPSQHHETPEPSAMEHALTKVGQPPPKADVRFQIEAYFRLLELRFILSMVAYSRIDGLALGNLDEPGQKHRQLWIDFIDFIYASCTADSQKALAIAKKASASRLVARCSIYIMRSEFECFRFQTITSVAALPALAASTGTNLRERTQIVKSVRRKKEELMIQAKERREEYTRSRLVADSNALREEWTWFDENCGISVKQFVKDLAELEEFIIQGDKYQPVSLQEKEDILKALDFATTGHFYNCLNGHPFVITECGGAMERARCPECGEEIGGSRHSLLASNSRATEFEAMLRERGARPGYVDHPDFSGNNF